MEQKLVQGLEVQLQGSQCQPEVTGACRGVFGQFICFFCILTCLEDRRYYS